MDISEKTMSAYRAEQLKREYSCFKALHALVGEIRFADFGRLSYIPGA